MKPSEILREAARRIERTEDRWNFSCNLIREIGNYSQAPEQAYRVLLGRMPNLADFEGWNCEIPQREANGHRIIALCLAAAIAESEGE